MHRTKKTFLCCTMKTKSMSRYSRSRISWPRTLLELSLIGRTHWASLNYLCHMHRHISRTQQFFSFPKIQKFCIILFSYDQSGARRKSNIWDRISLTSSGRLQAHFKQVWIDDLASCWFVEPPQQQTFPMVQWNIPRDNVCGYGRYSSHFHLLPAAHFIYCPH